MSKSKLTKEQQKKLIQSIIKSDEKDKIYSEVAVCDHNWKEWKDP